MTKQAQHAWLDWAMVEGDTAPSLPAILVESDGTPADLTGVSSIEFIMAREGSTRKVQAPMQVVDASKGKVRYNWAEQDTDEPGFFLAYVKVTYGDGSVATYPGTRYWEIEIRSKL